MKAKIFFIVVAILFTTGEYLTISKWLKLQKERDYLIEGIGHSLVQHPETTNVDLMIVLSSIDRWYDIDIDFYYDVSIFLIFTTVVVCVGYIKFQKIKANEPLLQKNNS